VLFTSVISSVAVAERCVGLGLRLTAANTRVFTLKGGNRERLRSISN